MARQHRKSTRNLQHYRKSRRVQSVAPPSPGLFTGTPAAVKPPRPAKVSTRVRIRAALKKSRLLEIRPKLENIAAEAREGHEKAHAARVKKELAWISREKAEIRRKRDIARLQRYHKTAGAGGLFSFVFGGGSKRVARRPYRRRRSANDF